MSTDLGKSFSRINLSYILLGGVVARSVIDPMFFNLSANFNESIAALTLLTSLISGLLIVFNLHRGVNFIILNIYALVRRDPIWRIKVNITRREIFTPILDGIYGNGVITCIMILSSFSYWTAIPNLVSFKVPIVSPDIDLAPVFSLSSVFMIIITALSIYNGKRKLDAFAYFEWMTSDHISDQQSEDKYSKWLRDYRNNIPGKWDLVLEEFEKERILNLDQLTKLECEINGFNSSFGKIMQDVKSLLDLGVVSSWSSSGDIINKFWSIWFKLPYLTSNVDPHYRGERWIKSTEFMLDRINRTKFSNFLVIMENISSLQRDLNSWQEKFRIENFSNVSEDLKRLNSEAKYFVLKAYENENPVVREFLGQYQQRFLKEIKPVVDFYGSGNYNSSDRRIQVYADRVKLTDVITNIITHRNALYEQFVEFSGNITEYMAIINTTKSHLERERDFLRLKRISLRFFSQIRGITNATKSTCSACGEILPSSDENVIICDNCGSKNFRQVKN